MNSQEQQTQTCPGCGYPTHAGHSSNCPLNLNKESPYSSDYSKVPDELRKFIIPHGAEGPTTHELAIKETGFKIPVSFHVEGNNFYITGTQSETNTGAIIWGNITGDKVKIKHIELAKNLRGTGVGKGLLADLENQLKSQDVKIAYAAFYKPGTVEFFLKSGYKITSLDSIPKDEWEKLEVEPSDFDDRVSNEDDFKKLINQNNQNRKVLLAKKI